MNLNDIQINMILESPLLIKQIQEQLLNSSTQFAVFAVEIYFMTGSIKTDTFQGMKQKSIFPIYLILDSTNSYQEVHHFCMFVFNAQC